MAVNERIAEHAMAFPGMPVRAAFMAACLVVASVAALADTTILNVSYDVSRELYNLGLLSKIDQAVLAAYCQCYARWVKAERAINEE